MGLLPCLRRGSTRWWLPLSAGAGEMLASILVAQAQGRLSQTPGLSETPGVAPLFSGVAGDEVPGERPEVPAEWHGGAFDRRLWQGMCQRLRRDPPLLIYAALHQSAGEVTLGELADWWLQHATAHLASGDAFLDAPDLGPAEQRRFRKLRDHFRTLPLARWLEDARLWLEVLGPRVPPDWHQQWPRLIAEDESGEAEGQTPSPALRRDALLQQLARAAQRQQTLERAFDASLNRSKLEAVKQLAYGLSHEINNPLANISTRAQQLAAGEQEPTRAASLQRIVEQVYRAHEMIADLMFYANPPEPELRRCELGPVVRTVVERFSADASRQAIALKIEVPAAPIDAVVDEAMIAEALGVLIRNSLEAIGDHGTIVASLWRRGDEAIVLEVADSGPGLSAGARQHAFDPYFSGREAGRGLGLGLCRAYRIAQLHRAEIELTAAPAGCVATITLPGG